MPHRLKKRQEKLQGKRKNTPWREFVKEICSWYNLNLYQNNTLISRYPQVSRNKNIIKDFSVSMNCEDIGEYKNNFINDLKSFYTKTKKSHTLNFSANENCEFTDSCYGGKNGYLSFGVGYGVENFLYSTFCANNCTNIFNSFSVNFACSNIFMSTNIKESHNVFYSTNIFNSSNIWNCSNLIGCSECIDCNDLQNQSYYIKNIKYEKDDYLKEKEIYLRNKSLLYTKYIKLLGLEGNISCKNVTGKAMLKCENINNGYYCADARSSRNVALFSGGELGSFNFFDGIDIGLDSYNFYGVCQAGTSSHDVYCCVFSGKSSNVYYCMNLDSCSYCLGCIGLKNKSYCILNKQYTKEERYDKVDEIFTQMEKTPHPNPLLAGEGENALGAFFPGSMNPFYFNDTAAYLIDDSFTKEEVEAEGYLRRDEKIKVDIPEGAEIVYTATESLPPQEGQTLDDYQGRKVKDKFYPLSKLGNKTPKADSGAERWIDPEILKKVIQDKEGNYYKIVKMEYDFLMKHGLPLPKLHWLDRIKLGFKFK